MRIATVGNEVILASDVMPRVDSLLAKNRDRIPASQLPKVRWMYAKQMLDSMLDTKRVMQDFKRTVPAERLPDIRKEVDKSFEDSRLPQLLDSFKVGSRAELDAKLQQQGSSLETEKNKYFERSLAQQWLRQQTTAKQVFAHDELMAYYEEHLKDFEETGKVRWQELSVQFSKHASKGEAYAKLAEMGNAVLQGAAFGQVASQSSEGITSDEGGVRDWTTQGSLAAEELDRALFTLPPNQLSPIIEGTTAFHIVRVLERVDRHVKPFREAQVEIHDKLKEQAEQVALDEYQDRLRSEIRVWTVFDDPAFVERIGLPPLPPRR